MRFVKQSVIKASQQRVFEFHQRPEVLKLLIPPWEKARVIQPAKISDVGSETIIQTRVGPVAIKWVARHTLYEPPRMFEDVQVKGPFRSWRHRHTIEPHPAGATLHDDVEYELPFGFVGRLLAPAIVEERLRRLFDYRHEVTRIWCEAKFL